MMWYVIALQLKLPRHSFIEKNNFCSSKTPWHIYFPNSMKLFKMKAENIKTNIKKFFQIVNIQTSWFLECLIVFASVHIKRIPEEIFAMRSLPKNDAKTSVSACQTVEDKETVCQDVMLCQRKHINVNIQHPTI